MLWLAWLTYASIVATLLLVALLLATDPLDSPNMPQQIFPPVFSEIIERRKSAMIMSFSFVITLIVVNVFVISVILQNELPAIVACVMFFAALGVIAFDVSRLPGMHYLFVFVVFVSVTVFVNIIPMGSDAFPASAYNFCAAIFVFVSLYVFAPRLLAIPAPAPVLPTTDPHALLPPPNAKKSDDVANLILIPPASAPPAPSDPHTSHPHTHIPRSPATFEGSRTLYSLCETLWLLAMFLFFGAMIWVYHGRYNDVVARVL
jgi:hypothetical protein